MRNNIKEAIFHLKMAKGLILSAIQSLDDGCCKDGDSLMLYEAYEELLDCGLSDTNSAIHDLTPL